MMHQIKIATQKPYDVCLEEAILDKAGPLLLKQFAPCKLAVIADEAPWRHYGDRLLSSLTKAGFSVMHYIFQSNEAVKSFQTVEEILQLLAENELTRSDILLSFGGGITGDITGFCAATYLRGISYAHMPTTLLAMIDAAIGGKTAVNLKAGKNLAGAFWQPALVLCDPTLLATLPETVLADGLAEAVKYGILSDAALFDASGKGTMDLTDMIARCIQIKGNILALDERDQGARRLLNLGHTIAHAVEMCSAHTLSHGAAVSIGLVASAKLAYTLGVSATDLSGSIADTLTSHNLPVDLPYTVESLLPYILKDKKRTGNFIHLILPEAIGRCRIEPLPIEQLRAVLTDALLPGGCNGC